MTVSSSARGCTVDGIQPAGKVSPKELGELNIDCAGFHGNRNYVIRSRKERR